jgi:leucyl-tRNA synthetase
MAKKVRELTARDKVGLAAYAVLGREYLTEAFKCTHDIKNARPESIYSMQSRWINGKQEKEFIESIREQYTDILMQNIAEDAELTDKQLSTIIQRGIVAEKDLKKQSDMSLKLMQWRKDAKMESKEKDRRIYVLRFLSHCKTCELMKMYLDVQEEMQSDK